MFGTVVGVVLVVLFGGDVPSASRESVRVSSDVEVRVFVCEDSDVANDALA